MHQQSHVIPSDVIDWVLPAGEGRVWRRAPPSEYRRGAPPPAGPPAARRTHLGAGQLVRALGDGGAARTRSAGEGEAMGEGEECLSEERREDGACDGHTVTMPHCCVTRVVASGPAIQPSCVRACSLSPLPFSPPPPPFLTLSPSSTTAQWW